jgi:hypothetical protein
MNPRDIRSVDTKKFSFIVGSSFVKKIKKKSLELLNLQIKTPMFSYNY